MREFDEAPLQIGKVALTVRDLGRTRDFYRDVVGLHELGRDGETVTLGAGRAGFLELRRDAHARLRSSRDAGLFHTAFLLPARADLARWLRHAADTGVAIQGASDHVVSEAIYLSDPEGNGIEIYADRPSSDWAWQDGVLAMRTDPLDRCGLLGEAGALAWSGAPEGTRVGHVHLQVGATAPAEAFYGGVVGLDLTTRYPGASFFASGGYHHHLAANVWNSRGAPPRTEPATGLAEVAIDVRDAATRLAEVAAKADAAGIAVEAGPGTLSLRDPWNTAITLRASAD